ncbi:PKD domain-containing protein, partial [Candidatus Bathyarchaeota archaeon]|nr:PKD domain-containing protein [Candidatus Bathyarchaeota archaeon]
MRRKTGCVWLTSLFTLMMVAGIPLISQKVDPILDEGVITRSETHSKISIDGNDELDAFFAGNSSMNGTMEYPYSFNNFSITGGGSGSCIHIQNTNKYFNITNCTLENSGSLIFDSGVRLENCTNVNITECTIQSNYNGMLFMQASNINVISCNVSVNDELGVWILGTDKMNVTDCDFIENGDTGVLMEISNLTKVERCNISDNVEYGINIDDRSNNNQVFFCIFKTNGKLHALDDGISTTWDNGIFGNYWDNYTARYTNATNDELIWNVPYEINGSSSSKDGYPLVSVGSHDPFTIHGNTELDSFPTKTGSGTEGDPYVIKNLVISARGTSYCIEMHDIDKHVKIINCTVSGALENTTSRSMFFYNCSNLTIENCTVKYNYDGISLRDSVGNNVINCSIINNSRYGIVMRSSSYHVVENNTVLDNDVTGIYFWSSSSFMNVTNNTCKGNLINGILISGTNSVVSSNTLIGGNYGVQMYNSMLNELQENTFMNCTRYGLLVSTSDNNNLTNNSFSNCQEAVMIDECLNMNFTGNQMDGCSMAVDGTLGECATYNITTSNTVNGDPVYYFVGETNLVPANYSGAGEVILVGCFDSVLSGIVISNTTVGILVVYGSNITISNNSVDQAVRGIECRETGSGLMEFNNLTSCVDGIFLDASDSMDLSFNQFNDTGIWLSGSLAECASHGINTSNTVNGNPLYYFIHEENLRSSNFTSPGQIILVNCTGGILDHMTITNTSSGIILISCANNTMNNTTVNGCSYGAYLSSCIDLSFSNFTSSDNSLGIFSAGSSSLNISGSAFETNDYGYYGYGGNHVNVLNCSFSENAVYGFYSSSDNITLGNNTFQGNDAGFLLYYSEDCEVMMNNATGNNIGGWIYGASSSTFSRNTFKMNNYTGMQVEHDASDNTIFLNNFINNSISQAIFQDNIASGTTWDNGTHGNYWSDYEARYPSATNDGTRWSDAYWLNQSSSAFDHNPLVYMYEPDLSPFANFTANDTEIISHGFVQFTFTGNPGNTPQQFQWDFGDGSNNSTLKNPAHQFNTTGSFAIILTVTDRDGEESTIEHVDYIQVTNLFPSCSFTADDETPIPFQNVTFTFTGNEGDLPATFEWDFGDGSANSTLRNPIHAYNATGQYTVSVTVQDANGDSDHLQITNFINVIDNIPIVNFNANATILLNGSQALFHFTGSPGDLPTSYEWNFGDGTQNATTSIAVHQFNSSGKYTITLTVTDANNDTDTLQRVDFIEVFNPGIDSDGDGLLNEVEILIHHTHPGDADSDGDSMPDGWEIGYALDPNDALDAYFDDDIDGLKNNEEYAAGTDPTRKDTDADGLDDWSELNRHGTDPTRKDTDGDGYSDRVEIRWWSDPINPGETPLLTWIFLSLLLIAMSAVFSFIIVKMKRRKKKAIFTKTRPQDTIENDVEGLREGSQH